MSEADTPSKPRDALVFLLDRQADAIEALGDRVVALGEKINQVDVDRATAAGHLIELRGAVDRLATAAAEQAAIARAAAAQAKEERDAAAAAAAARWGAIGKLGDSKLAVGIWTMFGTIIGGALTAKLAAWLGIPVATILGAKP